MSFSFSFNKRIVWNPTPFKVVVEFEKNKVELLPYGEINTTNDELCGHIKMHYSEFGVVILDDREIGNLTFDEYKSNKEVEGLLKCLTFKQECLRLENLHIQSMKLKTNLDISSIPNRVDIFIKEISFVENLLKKISNEFRVPELEEIKLPERPDWKKKDITSKPKISKDAKEKMIENIVG